MNKYLEKIAAKLNSSLKQEIRDSVKNSVNSTYSDSSIPSHDKKYVLGIEGHLGHDTARDMLNHKYGKTYAKGHAKPYSETNFISSKRNFKDFLGTLPVSKRKDSIRAGAVVGRILRMKSR